MLIYAATSITNELDALKSRVNGQRQQTARVLYWNTTWRRILCSLSHKIPIQYQLNIHFNPHKSPFVPHKTTCRKITFVRVLVLASPRSPRLCFFWFRCRRPALQCRPVPVLSLSA